MTQAQKLTLRTHILANTTQLQFGGGLATIASVFSAPFLNAGDAFIIAQFYNQVVSPSFTVWKLTVTKAEIATCFVGTELSGLTANNHTRLATVAVWFDDGMDPSKADMRAMLDDIFSGAGGTNTRARLLIMYKRLATNIEKVFATGTGTDAVPAILVLVETISGDQISDIKGLP